MAKLEVRNLTISFRTNNGAVRAVRDISFDLNEGETLAIAGESGSGKSVTTRAVMGILAGNAMVDDGEIIYDGKDLLKIPEEDFHTLRGHKLSMVFQDPLSALNPIMRIGKQLTEAMILNNKERRADGKKRLNDYLNELERQIAAYRVTCGEGESAGKEHARSEIATFREFVNEAVRQENEWNNALENAIGAQDNLEEIDLALIRKDAKEVQEITGRMVRSLENVYNPYVIPAGDTAFKELVQQITAQGKHFALHDEESFREKLRELSGRLERVTGAPEEEKPDFFALGYAAVHSVLLPQGGQVSEINRAAREALDQAFLNGFVRDIQGALDVSGQNAAQKRLEALQVLEKEKATFASAKLRKHALHVSASRCADAVEAAIDRLALEKDSQAWVFRSSMNAYIERYFAGLEQNPREQKRYDRDTVKYEKGVRDGKFMPSVVPLNLIDTQKARDHMIQQVDGMIRHFQALGVQQSADEAEARSVIGYLKDRASESAYHLTQSMARHRAIVLMKEVGIPEPHKRFHQYPFEFSGGMRQRIVIAIALSANPDILICDEPTTALDVTIQAQILELINRIKRERRLSVIFITHDLGVVANMADRIAIMYAGKIVEYGTADDVFYDPRHPYTWALLASMPDLETKEKLEAIPGTPPNMILPPKGDAFAARNRYAMDIDFEEQPPMFRVSDTHWAATWLLHPNAPKVDPPAIVTERIEAMRRREEAQKGGSRA